VAPLDLDIVTSMPLARLEELGRSMCPRWPTLDLATKLKGRHTVGEAPPAGTLMDIAVFKKALPGTEKAIFGSEFEHDVRHRDFSCNSLYFDPINQALIDPTGVGLSDTSSLSLRPVFDAKRLASRQKAKMAIRTIRFFVDGFRPPDEHHLTLSQLIGDGTLGAMPKVELIALFKAQLLSRFPMADRPARIIAARDAFLYFNAEQEWRIYFANEERELLS
jgi:hypothetical protein